MTNPLDPVLTPILSDAIRLHAQRKVLKERIRVEANKVDRYTVLERRRMISEWSKQVHELTVRLNQILPHLSQEDRDKLTKEQP